MRNIRNRKPLMLTAPDPAPAMLRIPRVDIEGAVEALKDGRAAAMSRRAQHVPMSRIDAAIARLEAALQEKR